MNSLLDEAQSRNVRGRFRSPLAASVLVLVAVAVPLVVTGHIKTALGLTAGLLVLASVAYLASPRVTPALMISLTVAASSFSGHWRLVGSPVPLDRVFFVLAIGLVVLDAVLRRSVRVIRWRPIHVVLGFLLAYATVSALAVGTLTSSTGFFALLDRLGAVPMLAFIVAGLAFPNKSSRGTLLVVLVILGGYLAVTAALEGLGLGSLAWPAYINDRSVGIQFGRARGPFAESVAMGIAMFDCAVAAFIASRIWQGRLARRLALVVAVACLVTEVFTLTRAIWIGTVLAILVTFAVVPEFRRWLAPTLVAGTVAVVAVLLLVPGLLGSASSRAASQSPIWDRLNTNRAALAMVEAHPLFGVGWDRFTTESPIYLRQGVDYPLTGVGIEVHDVLLSHATELGLVGATLWLIAMAGSVGYAVIRRAPPELRLWRYGLLAIAIQFAVAAAVGPLSYAFANLLLWLWAGIVLMPYLTEARYAEREA